MSRLSSSARADLNAGAVCEPFQQKRAAAAFPLFKGEKQTTESRSFQSPPFAAQFTSFWRTLKWSSPLECGFRSSFLSLAVGAAYSAGANGSLSVQRVARGTSGPGIAESREEAAAPNRSVVLSYSSTFSLHVAHEQKKPIHFVVSKVTILTKQNRFPYNFSLYYFFFKKYSFTQFFFLFLNLQLFGLIWSPSGY